MAYVIAQPCVGVKDTACIAVCPMDCIHPKPDESGFVEAAMLYINPAECIDCGLCAGECPVNAIFLDDDLPAEWADFVQRNAEHYKLG